MCIYICPNAAHCGEYPHVYIYMYAHTCIHIYNIYTAICHTKNCQTKNL